MKVLSIDIETFSSVNLQKCGVYKYAESEDFEILLFGYAVDGGAVQVVDLACGEKIPAEIIEALTDDAVIKTAFNAAFERVCLSRFLSDMGVSLDPFHDNHPLSQECARYLNPASWHCTMIWSATLGLPLSLEGVGAVLGLEKQKLTEGKSLIKYFCVPCAPTKTNGGRTRNPPQHDMEKWQRFKAYNLRDVETEMGIQAKLSRFPVPDRIWDEYHVSEEINDRGIGVDMVLVKEAIEIDSKSRDRLTSKMQDMTNFDNPNSVQQMKSNINDNEYKITVDMLEQMNDLRVTDGKIDDIINSEKGSRVAGEALYFLGLDWINKNFKYEQDHLHPYDRFDSTKPISVSMDDWRRWRGNRNRLPSLQLLEGRSNVSKNAMRLVDYYNDMNDEQKAVFHKEALIPDGVSLELENFEEFYEKRKELLTAKIRQLLG